MNTIMRKLIAIGLLGVVVAPCAWGVMSQPVATAMDKNRDGDITSEEYALFYDSDFSRRDRGDDGVLTPQELTNQNLFRLGDRNKDGQLTREEFQGIYTPRFARFDTNGDGLIAGDEIEHVPGCITQTVVYSRPDGKELTLDIDLPSGNGPFPVVVWVHGGGWTGGDSSAFVEYSQRMTLNGIAGVRINYRLANAVDTATLEQTFSDVLASIAWVQSNAGKYHFDMKRFGIGGASAGGHLSALAAQKAPECIAYIGYCGGYDMVNRGHSGWPNEGLLRRFFGKTDEATLKSNSPLWQIRNSPPDTLLLHGTADRIIDPDISVRFAEALRSRGATVKLVQLEGASHGICHQSEFKKQCLAETEEFLCRVFGLNKMVSKQEQE
jgi:acetyl esterase/lipase